MVSHVVEDDGLGYAGGVCGAGCVAEFVGELTVGVLPDRAGMSVCAVRRKLCSTAQASRTRSSGSWCSSFIVVAARVGLLST
ncbi:hypothetical protein [Rhodococcus wratislaviensis]|uniref:hypothetical protein n=1 Tax=Rhodococcus wratislaviensis TaxID=44752 RepID=UPI00364CB256